MNKEKLNQLYQQKQTKIDELIARSEASSDVEQLKELHSEIKDVKTEMEELRALIDDLDQQAARQQTMTKVLATYGVQKQEPEQL